MQEYVDRMEATTFTYGSVMRDHRASYASADYCGDFSQPLTVTPASLSSKGGSLRSKRKHSQAGVKFLVYFVDSIVRCHTNTYFLRTKSSIMRNMDL
jgi:hypothetical protein